MFVRIIIQALGAVQGAAAGPGPLPVQSHDVPGAGAGPHQGTPGTRHIAGR